MDIHPARFASESFADYRVRRAAENEQVKVALAGMPADMEWRRYRFGQRGDKTLSMTKRSMNRKQRHAIQ